MFCTDVFVLHKNDEESQINGKKSSVIETVLSFLLAQVG